MRGSPIRPAALAAWLALGFTAFAVGWSVPLDDFWLTLASGRAIAEGADLTRSLNFSFTPTNPGALNPQWGAQLLLGSVPLGAALLLTVGASLGGLAVTLSRVVRTAGPVAAVVAMLAGIVVLGPHLLPRVQAFSILLMPVLLVALERWQHRSWLPAVSGLIVALWANLHGAFVIGMILPVLFLIGRVVAQFQMGSGEVLTDRRTVILVITSLAVLAAPLLNPVGIDVYAYAFGQASNPVIRAVSTEWQPAWPWIPIALPFWGLVVLLLVLRAWRNASVTELLVVGAMGLLAVSAIRSIPWFTLAVLPIVARALDAELARREMLSRALGSVPPIITSRGWRGPIPLIGLLILLLQLVRPALPAPIARLTTDQPVALVDQLDAQLTDDGPVRIFNEQAWGGYLVYRMDSRVKTYLDGRLETATSETWRAYYNILAGGSGADELERLDVDWVLVRHRHRDLTLDLAAHGFTQAASSPEGVLLRAPIR